MGRHSMQSLAWHCFPERDPRGPRWDHPAVPAGPERVEVLGSVNYKLSLTTLHSFKLIFLVQATVDFWFFKLSVVYPWLSPC